MEYAWYEIIKHSREITQGDIITDCPIIEVAKISDLRNRNIKANIRNLDVVIMSQACDLANSKVDYCILCPVLSLQEFQLNAGQLEEIRKGRQPAYHMINEYKSESFEEGIKIIDFRNIFSLPVDNLKDVAEQKEYRLRLLPPYREHLAQAFARFFMRIGLPTDISTFR